MRISDWSSDVCSSDLLINRALASLGLIDEPLPLLYNDFAIVTGLVYGYLPFMILALYSSISRLNPEIREASADLGAPGWKTFLRVTLPLTLPGIAAGPVFVFVLRSDKHTSALPP